MIGAAHHVLGMDYLDIEALTIRQILRYFEINSMGVEMFAGNDEPGQGKRFVETFNRVSKFGVR